MANAFSLALPQGNPANPIVMERLGPGPGEFIAHLFVPSVLATLFIPVPTATSLGALILLVLVASAVAGAVNNLPASVVRSGILGSHSLPACAALTGLSVGSLATPHGSVATTVAVGALWII